MKLLVFVPLLFFLTVNVCAQEISEAQIAFVNDFSAAVQDHNEKSVYRCLDKNYRKSQRRFLGGNKEQLINELFSGNDILSDQFVVIPLHEITKIEVAEVEQNEDGTYTYIFRVRDGEHDILAPLLLIKVGKRYGFEGASG